MPLKRNKVGIVTQDNDEGHRVSCGRKRRGRRFRKSSAEKQDEASSYLTAVHCIYAFASWFGRGMVKANKVLTFSQCRKSSTVDIVDEDAHRADKIPNTKKTQNDTGIQENGKNHTGIGTSTSGDEQVRMKFSEEDNALFPPPVIPHVTLPTSRNTSSDDVGKLSTMEVEELASALSTSHGDSKTGNMKNETDHDNENPFVAPPVTPNSKTMGVQQVTPPPNSVPSFTTGILPQPCLSLEELDTKIQLNAVTAGIDDELMKFMKQSEDQKKLLMRGLESIVSAKLWFEKSLKYVNEKQNQLNVKRNGSSEPVKTVKPAENICHRDFSIGDAFGNFKFDSIAETEKQIKSLVNTARRLQNFLRSTKKRATDKRDRHRTKKIDNKSTQTCGVTNGKPKAEVVSKLDDHNYEADYEDESHDEDLRKSLKNSTGKEKLKPIHDIPRRDSTSAEIDDRVKEVKEIYELKQNKKETKEDQEMDVKYDESYYEDDFESDDDDSCKSSSEKDQKMDDKYYEALYEDDFESDDSVSTKS
uniref:uncharacterized protein LOC120342943 isoform X2 n=1 Tax=Styela clava TaxID=7725 RepID=UPI00193A1931|nr:uncharacterized protein LOC120342943 isoform X2 [Styela clava]